MGIKNGYHIGTYGNTIKLHGYMEPEGVNILPSKREDQN